MATIGIDPGWKSCGVSIQDEGKVLAVKNFVPETYKDCLILCEEIDKWIRGFHKEKATDTVFIERFVAYAGTHSNYSEDILMTIGALRYNYLLSDMSVSLVRAIDWKQEVCKYLVRTKEFNNPYPSFDKKFSLLAAKELSGLDLETDHEADAICLSYMSIIKGYNEQRVQNTAR